MKIMLTAKELKAISGANKFVPEFAIMFKAKTFLESKLNFVANQGINVSLSEEGICINFDADMLIDVMKIYNKFIKKFAKMSAVLFEDLVEDLEEVAKFHLPQDKKEADTDEWGEPLKSKVDIWEESMSWKF